MESSSSSSSLASGAAAEAAAARACTPAAERSLSDSVVESSSSSSRDPGAAAEAEAARTAAGVVAAGFLRPGTGLNASPPTGCEVSAPFATVIAPTAAAAPPERTAFLTGVGVASEERFEAAAVAAAAGATVVFPTFVATFAAGTAGLLASDRRDLGAAAAAGGSTAGLIASDRRDLGAAAAGEESEAEACSDFSLARARALAGSGEARAVAEAAAAPVAVLGLATAVVAFGVANDEARASEGRAVAAPLDAAAAAGEALGARVSVGLDAEELGVCSALGFRACGLALGLGWGAAGEDAGAGEGAAFAGVPLELAAGFTGVAVAGVTDCRTGMPDAGRGNLLAL